MKTYMIICTNPDGRQMIFAMPLQDDLVMCEANTLTNFVGLIKTGFVMNKVHIVDESYTDVKLNIPFAEIAEKYGITLD